MVSLQNIESDLVVAMKAKDSVAVDALRALKTRIVNEQVAKSGAVLEEADIVALIRSEVKRRKEAAESFTAGGRSEMATKELSEITVLEKYLPAQMSEEQVAQAAAEVVAGGSFTVADFGKAMGQLKAKLGNAADGALMAKVLKEKLK